MSGEIEEDMEVSVTPPSTPHYISGTEEFNPGMSEASTPADFSGPTSQFTPTKEQKSFVAEFLRSHTCYELMPESSKLVVFDSQTRLKHAYIALVENEMNCAPLWDAALGQFTGLVSATDFIDLVRQYNNEIGSPRLAQPEEIERLTLKQIREKYGTRTRPNYLISVDADATLFTACEILLSRNIHRVCVVDPSDRNNVLYILTHIRILRFLVRHLKSRSPLLDLPIRDVKIGTFQDILFEKLDSPVIQVLNNLSRRDISSVPIVDPNGVLVTVYSKEDVLALAKDRMFVNLHIMVRDAIPLRSEMKQVGTCQLTDTLKQVMYLMASRRVHRVICVDQDSRVIGIVALSDLFKFFLGEALS
eukprot:TRINITY_DN6553_c0_g2_i8.p1 TRINITY_DN6553_c0_g2~~TRINITY_DN6553_c0_g2_i8.p1  ORF type:complete len:361 (+),score=57.64 TRINITY_DN6553_c0_g2_i8:133-1215(+)